MRKEIVISFADSGGYGGSEVFLLNLGKSLAKTIEVWYLSYSKAEVNKYLKGKTHIFPFRMDLVGDWKGFVKFFVLFPIYFFKVTAFFKIHQGVTLLAPGFSDKIIFSLLPKKFNLNLIWIEYASPKPLQKRLLGIPLWWYRNSISSAKFVVVPTKIARQNMIRDFNLNPKKIKVISVAV